MSKKSFKPGAMLSPLPVIMASVGDIDGENNIITIAWTGIVNTNPPMTYISVKPERYSHHMIEENMEFVINLVDRKLAFAADYCGVKSGKDIDKWKEMNLSKETCKIVKCPQIKESPASIECVVKQVVKLPSHHMFMAEIVNINIDEKIVDENGRICLDEAGLVCYNHGEYFKIAKEPFGKFGFSVMKPKTKKRINRAKHYKKTKKNKKTK